MVTDSTKPEQVYVTEFDDGLSGFRNNPQFSFIAINPYYKLPGIFYSDYLAGEVKLLTYWNRYCR
jgi:hypothetical protein